MTAIYLSRSVALLVAVVLFMTTMSFSNAQSYGRAFGGPHGTPFDDAKGYRNGERVSSIMIRSGSRVDMVKFSTQYRQLAHGGNGGGSRFLNLKRFEKIVRYEACWGKKNGKTRVFWVKFVTNYGNAISGGKRTKSCGGYGIPSSTVVFGMHGRSGKEVDKLGMVYA